MAARPGSGQRVAIAGASSLLGKELKLVLEDRNFPATDFVLLDEGVAAGTLTEIGGEPTFIKALDAESFEGARFAFFAGKGETAAVNWEAGIRAGAAVIDLTGGVPAESGAFSLDTGAGYVVAGAIDGGGCGWREEGGICIACSWCGGKTRAVSFAGDGIDYCGDDFGGFAGI